MFEKVEYLMQKDGLTAVMDWICYLCLAVDQFIFIMSSFFLSKSFLLIKFISNEPFCFKGEQGAKCYFYGQINQVALWGWCVVVDRKLRRILTIMTPGSTTCAYWKTKASPSRPGKCLSALLPMSRHPRYVCVHLWTGWCLKIRAVPILWFDWLIELNRYD